jgi:opacity protein-like surface antigen
MVAVAIAVLALPVMAQEDFPRAEVFGGYQFTHHSDPSLNLNGWNAALNGNFNRWFGVTADFSGSYKNGGHFYSYMFGPTIAARSEHVTPFVHALFGGATAGDGGSSDTAFAMALGGGLDANVGRHVAVRLVQADWLLLRSGGVTDKKNVRVSTGLVFRF